MKSPELLMVAGLIGFLNAAMVEGGVSVQEIMEQCRPTTLQVVYRYDTTITVAEELGYFWAPQARSEWEEQKTELQKAPILFSP